MLKPSEPERFISLQGGIVLPIAAVLLAMDLESRGCWFQLKGDDLLIGPRDSITDGDREQIRRWKRHLRAIVAYEAGTPAWRQ